MGTELRHPAGSPEGGQPRRAEVDGPSGPRPSPTRGHGIGMTVRSSFGGRGDIEWQRREAHHWDPEAAVTAGRIARPDAAGPCRRTEGREADRASAPGAHPRVERQGGSCTAPPPRRSGPSGPEDDRARTRSPRVRPGEGPQGPRPGRWVRTPEARIHPRRPGGPERAPGAFVRPGSSAVRGPRRACPTLRRALPALVRAPRARSR